MNLAYDLAHVLLAAELRTEGLAILRAVDNSRERLELSRKRIQQSAYLA